MDAVRWTWDYFAIAGVGREQGYFASAVLRQVIYTYASEDVDGRHVAPPAQVTSACVAPWWMHALTSLASTSALIVAWVWQ
jgi:hypothetical protein